MNAKEIIESKENKEELCKQHCLSVISQINAITYLFDDGSIKIKKRGKGCPIFILVLHEENNKINDEIEYLQHILNHPSPDMNIDEIKKDIKDLQNKL